MKIIKVDTKDKYIRDNGKHQEIASILFRQIAKNSKSFKYDDKNKCLKELADFKSFYGWVYFFSITCEFKKAVYWAKKNLLRNNYKGNLDYKCENYSELESIMDDLVFKAYGEQKKLGNI